MFSNIKQGSNVDFSRPSDVQIREKCDIVTKQMINLLDWEKDFEEIENSVMRL